MNKNDFSEADKRIEQLSTLLKQQADLLNLYNENSWATHFAALSERCRILDKRVLAERILQVYGGMGSFSDVVVAQKKGEDLERQEMIEANEKLDNLRRQIHELAVELLVKSRQNT